MKNQAMFKAFQSAKKETVKPEAVKNEAILEKKVGMIPTVKTLDSSEQKYDTRPKRNKVERLTPDTSVNRNTRFVASAINTSGVIRLYKSVLKFLHFANALSKDDINLMHEGKLKVIVGVTTHNDLEYLYLAKKPVNATDKYIDNVFLKSGGKSDQQLELPNTVYTINAKRKLIDELSPKLKALLHKQIELERSLFLRTEAVPTALLGKNGDNVVYTAILISDLEKDLRSEKELRSMKKDTKRSSRTVVEGESVLINSEQVAEQTAITSNLPVPSASQSARNSHFADLSNDVFKGLMSVSESILSNKYRLSLTQDKLSVTDISHLCVNGKVDVLFSKDLLVFAKLPNSALHVKHVNGFSTINIAESNTALHTFASMNLNKTFKYSDALSDDTRLVFTIA